MSTEETLDILEETMDVMDETLEVVETLVQAKDMASASGLYISKGYLLGAVVLFAGVGFGLYKFGVKQSQAKYEKLMAEEIAEAKAFYSKLNKKEDFSTPEKASKELKRRRPTDPPEGLEVVSPVEALKEYQGWLKEDDEIEEVEEIEPEEHESVYLQSAPDDEPQFDVDLGERTPDHPYVISEEEFLLGERDIEKTSITWYAGDLVLADERDKEIPSVDPIIGTDNLERFGEGSNDPNIVYIRNERLDMDFEVLKHDGKYAHEVLGLQHSDKGSREHRQANKPKRYRGEDM